MEKVKNLGLKKVLKTFFVKLHEKCDQLEKLEEEKKDLIEKAYFGKEEFEEFLNENDARLSQLKESNQKKYEELIQKIYDDCWNSKRFNESWDFMVMSRSPVSVKLAHKEPHTKEVFDEVTSGAMGFYKKDLYLLLTCTKANPKLEKVYKHALVELISEHSQSIDEAKYLAKERKIRLKYAGSKKEKNEIKKKHEIKEIELLKKLNSDYEIVFFVMNQVPELRGEVLNLMRGFNDFVKSLSNDQYPCFTPEEVTTKKENRYWQLMNFIFDKCGNGNETDDLLVV